MISKMDDVDIYTSYSDWKKIAYMYQQMKKVRLFVFTFRKEGRKYETKQKTKKITIIITNEK